MNKKKKIIWTVSIVVALLLVAISYIGYFGLPMKNGVLEEVTMTIDNDPTLGSDEAKVTFVEYADYKCHWCKQWHEEVFPTFKKDFIDTGKVKFVYKNYAVLAEDSVTAAIAGEAIHKQNPELFWKYQEVIFKHQGPDKHVEWATKEFILEIVGKEIPEVDIELLSKDMDSEEFLNKVEKDKEHAKTANVEHTPSIFINGKLILNPLEYEFLEEIIAEELSKEGLK